VADYDQIVSNVKSVTNEPIKYILSTHHHADHSGGIPVRVNGGDHLDGERAQQYREQEQSNAPEGMVRLG